MLLPSFKSDYGYSLCLYYFWLLLIISSNTQSELQHKKYVVISRIECSKICSEVTGLMKKADELQALFGSLVSKLNTQGQKF